MLKQRGNPLFEPLRSPLREFIGNLRAVSGPNGHV